MIPFLPEDFPVGRLVEVTLSTASHGIWAVSSDFYGFGLQGKVAKLDTKDSLLTVLVSATGFYGAWDSPGNPVQGKPFKVIIDLNKVFNIDHFPGKGVTDDLIRISMSPQ